MLACFLVALAALTVSGPPAGASARAGSEHRDLAAPDGSIELRVTDSGAAVSGDLRAFDADRIVPGFRRVVVLAIGNERDDDVAVALRTTGLRDTAVAAGRAELSGALRVASSGDEDSGGYTWSASIAEAQRGSGPVAVVRAHSTVRVRLTLELPWDAGNSVQSTAVSFDLGVTATAAPGPGGDETRVQLASVAAGTGAHPGRGGVRCWALLALALLAPLGCLLVPWSLRRRRIRR